MLYVQVALQFLLSVWAYALAGYPTHFFFQQRMLRNISVHNLCMCLEVVLHFLCCSDFSSISSHMYSTESA